MCESVCVLSLVIGMTMVAVSIQVMAGSKSKEDFVNWCFDPSQPLGITSGLTETFIERYIVERTNKAEIRPEEQSEKTERCRENLWNEILLKGP